MSDAPKDAPAEPEQQAVVLNPEAVGDPEQTPIVQLSPELLSLMRHCKGCNGLNGFHADDCGMTES